MNDRHQIELYCIGVSCVRTLFDEMGSQILKFQSSSVDKKRGQTRYYYVRLTILVMMMLYSRYTIRTDGFMCV